MTDKELRKLSRRQLVEMLLIQSRETEELRKKLDAAQKELESRELTVRKAGSIAEASLRLQKVFEAAQAAADQYLENIKRISAEQTKALKTGRSPSNIGAPKKEQAP